MNGLNEHLALLNTIESFFRISDIKHFPLYSFNVEFQVTREFFERDLRRLLEVDNV